MGNMFRQVCAGRNGVNMETRGFLCRTAPMFTPVLPPSSWFASTDKVQKKVTVRPF